MLTFQDGSTIVYKVKAIWEPSPRGFAVGKGTGDDFWIIENRRKVQFLAWAFFWNNQKDFDWSKKSHNFSFFKISLFKQTYKNQWV